MKKIVTLFAALFSFAAVFAATETVNGVTYTYSVENGKATIGSNGFGAAIPTETSGDLVIPSTLGGYPVTTIGSVAFGGCMALSSVTIPEGVTKIADAAFAYTSLRSVTIPASVTTIGASPFSYCLNLTRIEVEDGNADYQSLDGVLYTKDGLSLISCPGAKVSVMVPEGVTTISYAAFHYCAALESVSIPASVNAIASVAFGGCSSLRLVSVAAGDTNRVKNLIASSGSGVDVETLTFVERTNAPVIVEGDSTAEVTGDAENGFVVKPSAGTTDVVITIPEGVAAEKVTVEISPSVETIKANGATIKVVKGAADITTFLDIPAAVDGVVNLGAAEVKEEIVKEAMDMEKGAVIELSVENPTLTTSETKPGLTYTLVEGTTLDAMADGDSKVGDGNKWTPDIKVKGGASAFYSIKVTK